MISKLLIFIFSYYFFCIPGTHNSHGARRMLFLCFFVGMFISIEKMNNNNNKKNKKKCNENV